MKKNIILSILILFVFNLNFAQIDRTKQPDSGPDPEIKFGTPKTFKLKTEFKFWLSKMINFQ